MIYVFVFQERAADFSCEILRPFHVGRQVGNRIFTGGRFRFIMEEEMLEKRFPSERKSLELSPSESGDKSGGRGYAEGEYK